MILEEIRPHRAVKFKYHDVEEGVVECVLSRGDRRLGRVIEDAWRRGARFDAWSDHFDYGRWLECMQTAGLEPDMFLRRIPLHAPLPWDHIDSRVTKQFIIEDLHRGMKGKFSPACEKPFIPRDPSKPVKPLESANLVCYACGLECDLEAIKQERIAQRDSLAGPGPEIAAAFRGETLAPKTTSAPIRFAAAPTSGRWPRDQRLRSGEWDPARRATTTRAAISVLKCSSPATPHRLRPNEFTYRVEFAKHGDLRWLSHLDLTRALQRGLRRAGFPLRYSQGFHPAPVASFGPALAVGIEAEAELLDFECTAAIDVATAAARLGAVLPAAMQVRSVREVRATDPSLAASIQLGEYSAWWNEARLALTPGEFADLSAATFHNPVWQQQRIENFLGRETVIVSRTSKGRTKELDVRQYVRSVEYRFDRKEVRLWLRVTSQGGARPQEIMRALYDVPGTCFRYRREGLFSETAGTPAAIFESAGT